MLRCSLIIASSEDEEVTPLATCERSSDGQTSGTARDDEKPQIIGLFKAGTEAKGARLQPSLGALANRSILDAISSPWPPAVSTAVWLWPH